MGCVTLIVSGEMEPLMVTEPVTLPVPESVVVVAANAGTAARESIARVTMPASSFLIPFFIMGNPPYKSDCKPEIRLYETVSLRR